MPAADTPHRSMLRLWFSISLLGAGASGAEELNGAVGESVTFQVKISTSFVMISWAKIVDSKSRNISAVTFGKPCALLVPLPAYQKRVSISDDCRELHLSHLKKEDAGRYTAKIISQNNTVADESFDLSVYKTMGQPEELNGTLGASAVFRVKTAPPYERISWNRLASGHPIAIAVVTSEGTCSIMFPHPDVRNRLNVSRDCRELYLSHLKREDAGRYTGEIILPDKKLVDESFELRVFRRLLDSQLRVTCTPDGAGKGAWQLHCSTGSWEDGVEFSWTSVTQDTDPTLGSSAIHLIYRDCDLNVTCTAKNLVSQASRTVSLKQVCLGETGDLSGLPHWAKVFLSVVGSLLLPGSAGFILMIKLRRGGGGGLLVRFLTASRRRPPSYPSSEDRIRPR